MSNETITTVAGNLTADPDLRFTRSGVPVAHFTVASTSRVQDSSSGEWRDGDTLFLRCTVWRQMAQNVVESLRKGTRVVVTGRLQQRPYETDDGQKRSALELGADEVSVSLRHAIVRAAPSRARPDAAAHSIGAPPEQPGRAVE
jgi:single-strand DNA-binding protein